MATLRRPAPGPGADQALARLRSSDPANWISDAVLARLTSHEVAQVVALARDRALIAYCKTFEKSIWPLRAELGIAPAPPGTLSRHTARKLIPTDPPSRERAARTRGQRLLKLLDARRT